MRHVDKSQKASKISGFHEHMALCEQKVEYTSIKNILLSEVQNKPNHWTQIAT